MVVLYFRLTPDAEESIPLAALVHNQSGERYLGSRWSAKVGHSVPMHARQEGWECRRRLGRLHPANGNQGTYRAAKLESNFRHREEKYQKNKKRRRGRASRRLANKPAREARRRQKEALVVVAT